MLSRDVKFFSRREHPYSWTSFLKTVSGTYHGIPGDKCRILVCDTSSQGVTLYLPSAVDVGRGAMITIKDNGGAGTNNISVRVKGGSGEYIDGQQVITLDSSYTSLPLVSDGNQWLIL